MASRPDSAYFVTHSWIIFALYLRLGPAARMWTRAMYDNIENSLRPCKKVSPIGSRSSGWSCNVNIWTTEKAELSFWNLDWEIHKLNGQLFQRPLIHQVFYIDLDTDARSVSKKGWGAVLYLPEPDKSPDPILLLAARITPPTKGLKGTQYHCRLHVQIRFWRCLLVHRIALGQAAPWETFWYTHCWQICIIR